MARPELTLANCFLAFSIHRNCHILCIDDDVCLLCVCRYLCVCSCPVGTCICVCVRACMCVCVCVCVTSSKWRRWASWSFDRTALRTSRRAFRYQPRITIFPPHPLGALGWLFDREPSQLLRATVTCRTGCPSTAIIGYGTQQSPLPQGRRA